MKDNGMDSISQQNCAELCLKEPECNAFTQYDSGNGDMTGCFLFKDESKCRATGTTGWVSGIKCSSSVLEFSTLSYWLVCIS